MPIINPTQLVDEYKKSGEFDRLRRELLAQFRSGDNFSSFMARVEDITRRKLASDAKILSMSEASATRELMQELNRYPIVERAVEDAQSLSDPTFATSIREYVTRLLREDRSASTETAPGLSQVSTQISTPKPSLTVQTQITETGSGNQTPATQGGESTRVAETQSVAADGNDSEDSAMDESPISDVHPSESKAPFP